MPERKRTIKLPDTDQSVKVSICLDVDDRFLMFIDTNNIDLESMRVYLNKHTPDQDYTSYEPLLDNKQ